MMLFTKIVAFILSLYALPGIAVPLEDMKITDGDRVGIYLGTFDPITLGHQEVANLALKWGVKYVIFIPRDVAFHKPNHTAYKARLLLIEAIYRNHEAIGYPTEPYWVPSINGISKRLKKAGANLVGIIGEDIIQSNKPAWLNTTAMFGRVDEWLVVERRSDKNLEAPQSFAGRPVTHLPASISQDRQYMHASSTKARTYLQEHPEFFTNGDLPPTQVTFLDPRVSHIIREMHLYAPSALQVQKTCKLYRRLGL